MTAVVASARNLNLCLWSLTYKTQYTYLLSHDGQNKSVQASNSDTSHILLYPCLEGKISDQKTFQFLDSEGQIFFRCCLPSILTVLKLLPSRAVG